MLTGRVVKLREARGNNPIDALKRLVARSGEPVIRQAVRQAVKLLGDQFVLGRTIREALVQGQEYEEKGYLFSYDMLGESARTQKDADVYFERYLVGGRHRRAGGGSVQRPARRCALQRGRDCR